MSCLSRILAITCLLVSGQSNLDGVQVNWDHLPQLVAGLESVDDAVRAKSCEQITQEIGSFEIQYWSMNWEGSANYLKHSAPLIPRLVKLLESKDEAVVNAVLYTLLGTGEPGQAAATAVAKLANDPNQSPEIRYQAFSVIWFLVPKTKSVLEQIDLVKVFSDPEDHGEELGEDSPDFAKQMEISGQALLAVAVYRNMLHSDHTRVEIPALIRIFEESPSKRARLLSLFSMGDMGHDADVAIPALRKAVHSNEHLIARVAASLLVEIEGTKECIEFVLSNLKLNDEDRKQFETDANKRLEIKAGETEIFRKTVVECDDEGLAEFKTYLPLSLGQNQREMLRAAKTSPRFVAALEPEIRALLNNHDSETRKLAAEALEILNRK